MAKHRQPPRLQGETETIDPVLESLVSSLEETRSRAHSPLRCISCGNPVTSEAERFDRDGKNQFHFVNPGGYQFDICLYGDALGCYSIGEAAAEHSWFDGYTWRFAHCCQCDLHLGWLYEAPGKPPFWGLITALLTNT